MSDAAAAPAPAPPLAEALRPHSLGEVYGQRHLLGPGGPLDVAFKARRPHSMILWGPPGVGKTTLARLAAAAFDAEFIALPAVLSGVQQVRAALECAAQHRTRGRRSTLFIDEIHRLDQGQQQLLLPALRAGHVTLIGATTENPSFALKGALLSCARVHVLKALTDDELDSVFRRAQQRALTHLQFEPAAVAALVAHADGDARRCLNLLALAGAAADAAAVTVITPVFMAAVLSPPARRFDKGGEQFYDQISALHKSVRGSSPDAALYWLCRMLDGGADHRYLLRRLAAMAWDDIGLADPRAIRIVHDAAATCDLLGAEDGALALAQAVLYLAMATKSNAGARAYAETLQSVRHHH